MKSLAEPITVVRYDASMQALWDRFVVECKNYTFLFERGYIDYNPRFIDYSLLFYKREKLIGLLPANIDGDTLASHAGLTYGGFLLPKSSSSADVLGMFAALRVFLQENTSVSKVVYRPVPHTYASYPAEEDLYALFRCGASLVERRVSSVVRQSNPLPLSTLRSRKVRMAQKVGFSIVSDCGFEAFWAVLCENLQKVHKATPVHSLNEIELLASRFPNNIRLFRVVDDAGTTVAGTVLYLTDNVARVQYIGSVQRGRENGALDLLFHHLLYNVYPEKAYFDFGTSVEDGGRTLNEGLIFQKEGFGGRAVVYDTYMLDVNSII